MAVLGVRGEAQAGDIILVISLRSAELIKRGERTPETVHITAFLSLKNSSFLLLLWNTEGKPGAAATTLAP